MKLRQRSSFSFVRTEGAILPAELLSRIQEGDPNLGGLRPEDYHLISGERLNEAISRSWNRLLGAWASFQTAFANLPPGDPAVGITREKLLLPLFDELHYGRLSPTKALEINGKTYPVSHGWRSVPIHLVGFGIKLDQRTAGVAGAAKYSPHGMMQELLNRSDDHLWGFVSNGMVLRILRDNASLTRQAYVEFNLESIFDGEAYADFALLWLLCHQSRVETERPEEFWIERWSQTARTEGARALDRLRDGVENAIRALGRGFISHPANQVLRDRLRKGDLSTQDYYRQLLRIVYRMIFLFAAEDRELLFPPQVPGDVRDRYRRFYSTSRLRSLAARRRGTAHTDLFRGLQLIMGKMGEPKGCPELGLPPLGSFLWSVGAVPDLEPCQIANHDLLTAVRHLALSEESGVRRPIDYKNLGAEELGSVYEALLELHPEVNIEARTFELRVVGGSERKTTGSYYTPSSLIQQLLSTALDPVTEDALSKPNPEKALLDLKVCDTACGSGHFLVAAAHRIARRLASVRTGDEEPSPDAQRRALRDVISHCIYGVDINPMAVELCKVNLWLETIDPGKPLSFLDHRIICGNSLLGTTPRLMANGIPDEAFNPIEGDDKTFVSGLKRQNRKERPKHELQEQGIASGQFSMFNRMFAGGKGTYHAVSLDASRVDSIEEDTIVGVQAKQEAFEGLVGSESYRESKLLADAWCAAFVWHKRPESPPHVTDSIFRKLAEGREGVSAETVMEIQRLADAYQFLHWHLAFPRVFRISEEGEIPENEQTGWGGGFNVVLGNPPWERVKLQEKEWFAGRNDEIATAPNKAARTRLIGRLREEDPRLYLLFLDAKRRAEGESQLVRNTGRYPLCGRGDVNTYAIFAELKRSLIAPTGRVGCIVPSGIATDDTTKFFFQDLTDRRSLASLHDFENRRKLFPAVDSRVKFCLLTMTGSARPVVGGADFVFFALDVADLKDEERHFTLTPEEIALLNPNTRTCPIFRTKRDAEITKGIYRRVPVLIKEGPPEENPWGIRFATMFHMSNDSGLFRTFDELEADGWRLEGNVFVRSGDRYLPLFEAKMVHHFDHRFGDYRDQPEGSESTVLPDVPVERKQDPDFEPQPRYWVPQGDVRERLQSDWPHEWLLTTRMIAPSTNERTWIGSLIGLSGVGNSLAVWLIHRSEEQRLAACAIANVNALVTDYSVRQKVGGSNLNFFLIYQFPLLPPRTHLASCPWHKGMEIHHWISTRSLELIVTSRQLTPFALDSSFEARTYRWDEMRRSHLRCELDAAFFHLYSIPRSDVDYIMDTFPIVRRHDEERYGEYRTKRLILEIYDEMQCAMETGEPYQTRLDPPPADPRVAHPAKDAS